MVLKTLYRWITVVWKGRSRKRLMRARLAKRLRQRFHLTVPTYRLVTKWAAVFMHGPHLYLRSKLNFTEAEIICFSFPVHAIVFINTVQSCSHLPSLTSASGMDGFCPDDKTMRTVLTWAWRCWRRRGRQMGWPAETIFLLFKYEGCS